jgi:predicted RNA-binding Zn-ribbon protein involved in translation (DUF1610 family)
LTRGAATTYAYTHACIHTRTHRPRHTLSPLFRPLFRPGMRTHTQTHMQDILCGRTRAWCGCDVDLVLVWYLPIGRGVCRIVPKTSEFFIPIPGFHTLCFLLHSVPTLVLAECVLAYLEPADSNAIFAVQYACPWCGESTSNFVSYIELGVLYTPSRSICRASIWTSQYQYTLCFCPRAGRHSTARCSSVRCSAVRWSCFCIGH